MKEREITGYSSLEERQQAYGMGEICEENCKPCENCSGMKLGKFIDHEVCRVCLCSSCPFNYGHKDNIN